MSAWKTEGGHRRVTLESLDRLLADPKQRALRQPAPSPEPRLRVMVVEDDPLLLILYQFQLQRWPMAPEIEIARDGFEALLKIGERQPHLLITDLMMPHLNGFEMVRKLRGMPELADMDIVAVSGLTPSIIEEHGGPPAGIPIYPKPIPFPELEELAVKLARRRGWTGSAAGDQAVATEVQ